MLVPYASNYVLNPEHPDAAAVRIILATRVDFLPLTEILAELRKLAVLVQKTGGDAEHEAFNLLNDHVAAVAHERGIDPEQVAH